MSKLIKQRIAEDMLKIAHMHNNILYRQTYKKYGIYTEDEINQSFGNYNSACRELKIVNPEDPHDLNAVLNDIRYVFALNKSISKQVYEEYGIYSVPALENQYRSFESLIISAIGKPTKPAKPAYRYPVYTIKAMGQNVLIRARRR